MAWMELHDSGPWHKKTIALAKELNVRRNEAWGALTTLWPWALNHAQDGRLGHLTDKEVAAAAGWHGNAAKFVVALNKTGWLDDDGSLHDWHDYAGRLIEQRLADLEKKRLDREAKRREREAAAEERRKKSGRRVA